MHKDVSVFEEFLVGKFKISDRQDNIFLSPSRFFYSYIYVYYIVVRSHAGEEE